MAENNNANPATTRERIASETAIFPDALPDPALSKNRLRFQPLEMLNPTDQGHLSLCYRLPNMPQPRRDCKARGVNSNFQFFRLQGLAGVNKGLHP